MQVCTCKREAGKHLDHQLTVVKPAVTVEEVLEGKLRGTQSVSSVWEGERMGDESQVSSAWTHVPELG